MADRDDARPLAHIQGRLRAFTLMMALRTIFTECGEQRVWISGVYGMGDAGRVGWRRIGGSRNLITAEVDEATKRGISIHVCECVHRVIERLSQKWAHDERFTGMVNLGQVGEIAVVHSSRRLSGYRTKH